MLASVNHLSNVAGTLERAGETIRGLGELGENDPDADAGGAWRRSAVGDAVDELTGGRKNVVTGALVGGGELAAGVLGGVGGIFTKSIAGKSRGSRASRTAPRAAWWARPLALRRAPSASARVVEGVEATVGDVQDGVTEALVATDATALAAAKRDRVACRSPCAATASCARGTSATPRGAAVVASQFQQRRGTLWTP